MEIKDILYLGAEIKLKIAKLEEEYDMLKPQLQQAVKELTVDAEKESVEVGDLGSFSLSVFRKWTYSAPTQEMAAHLEKVKEEEKQTGLARAEETPVIRFTVKK